MAASYLSAPSSHFHINHNARRIYSLSTPSPMFVSMPPNSSLQVPHVISASVNCRKVFRITALAQEAENIIEQPESAEEEQGLEGQKTEEKIPESPRKGTQLYVGNLPRACDRAQLTRLFQQFGTVECVEVICNEETGISRGFAHVTMSKNEEAIAAIGKLQGSDLGGRDMIVNFPERVLFTGVGHRVFIGNIAWSVKKETLRKLFSQYGNVVATRLFYDRRDGFLRVYGFVRFSKASEMEAAISAVNGMEFHGRKLVVRSAKSMTKDDKESDVDVKIIATPATMQEDNASKTLGTIITENPYRVFVGNLSKSVNNKALKDLFSEHGNVLDVKILFDHKTGTHRVFGFVTLSSQTEVDSAITALHRKEFQKRILAVQEAKSNSQA